MWSQIDFKTPTLAPPAARSISSCTAGSEMEEDTQTEPASLKREDLWFVQKLSRSESHLTDSAVIGPL